MSQNPSILLYGATWCPDCTRAARFLDEHGVAYDKVDISEDPQAAQLLEQKTGKRGIPFLVVGDRWVRAYSPGGGEFPAEEILEAVGLSENSG